MSSEQVKLPTPPAELDMRFTEVGDAPFLRDWLMDESNARWFPMDDPVEIDDAVSRWIGFYRYRCSLTATLNGVPCGLATLYLQPYRKLAHQCEFGIIVAPEHRNKGIGSDLMKNIIHLAKSEFKIELLHLQVYAKNPAVHLYERFGFKEFGNQKEWIKERDGTFVGRLFMEKNI
jgi:RimJ/RimL family protein N-acetyltransferase